MRLLRYLTRHTGMSSRDSQSLLSQSKIRVDDQIIREPAYPTTRFSKVEVDGQVLPHDSAVYLMLHKPIGHVSATVDPEHPTVIDLIDHPQKSELHLAGRLDRSTSGLVLLTNDGSWSKQLSDPAAKVPKTYLVETATPIPSDAVEKFAAGFHFHTENIVTQPAELTVTTPTRARLILTEGRYHQVKRMFHRVEARVVSLHRESIGPYKLPNELKPGMWCEIKPVSSENR